MAYPKKKKLDMDIVGSVKVGTEYLKYGFDRIEELMLKTDKKTNYLPRTIGFEHIDTEIFNVFKEGNFQLVIDGQIVPTFYLENERWGEFSKTWKFMDEDKNVPTPYVTIRRIGDEPGTRLGTKYRIPQPRHFRYLDVPILDEGEIIDLRFKIPQPVNVDLLYEIRLFTKYRVDFNSYDEQVFRNFASRQAYIWLKGTPIPVHLESIDEANSIENIDGDRFYVGVYNIRALGFIQNEKEFEITKTSRRPKFKYDLGKKFIERPAPTTTTTTTVAPTTTTTTTVAPTTTTTTTVAPTTTTTTTLPPPSPEAQAVLDRMTGLTEQEIILVSNFVDAENSIGNWDLIDEFVCYKLYLESNALIGWKGVQNSENNSASKVTWGFDTTVGWINTHFVPSVDGVNYKQNDAAMSTYMYENNLSGTDRRTFDVGDSRIWATATSGLNSLFVKINTDSQGSSHAEDTSYNPNTSPLFLGMERISINQVRGIKDGALRSLYSSFSQPLTAFPIRLGITWDGIYSTFTVSASSAVGFNHSAHRTNVLNLLNGL